MSKNKIGYRPPPEGDRPRVVQMRSPEQHFAQLGGYEGARAAFGVVVAHRLWDSVRLMARDMGDPVLYARWQQQYKFALARALEEQKQ